MRKNDKEDNGIGAKAKAGAKGIIFFSCRYVFPRRPTLADLSLADLEDVEDLP